MRFTSSPWVAPRTARPSRQRLGLAYLLDYETRKHPSGFVGIHSRPAIYCFERSSRTFRIKGQEGELVRRH